MRDDRPSSTSLLIARALVLAAEHPGLRHLVLGDSADLTRRFLAAAPPALWFELVMRFPFLRGLVSLTEHLCLPGVWLHWLARKCLIDALARDALEAGCQQMVVIGAGLDTLAFRLRPARQAFELDHPATQAIKRRLLPDRPILIPADIVCASVSEILEAHPQFDRAAPTLFVAEGLLMYLPAERVRAIFRELAALCAPGSQFVFTFMEEVAGRPICFRNERRIVGWWLRWRGERFTWALDRSAVDAFVADYGWKLCSLSSPGELRRRFLAPAGLAEAVLAEGESVAMITLRPS